MSMDKLEQQDRVTFGETIKISLETCGGNKYEFRDFFVSYSSDLEVNESFEAGLERVKAKVQSAIATCEADTRQMPEPEGKDLANEVRTTFKKFRKKHPERAEQIGNELAKNKTDEGYRKALKEMGNAD